MYFKHILATSLLALLSGSVAAQGQYGAVPSQSMAPESSTGQSSSMAPQSSNTTAGNSSMTRTSSVASNSATTTSGSYTSTPSTLSSSMRPASSGATSSDSGVLGGLLDNKKLNLRAEPGPMDEFTRAMPAGDYSQPASQPAAHPTN